MEMNAFVTTAFELNSRALHTERRADALPRHPALVTSGFVQHFAEIDGEAPLIVVMEAFDA